MSASTHPSATQDNGSEPTPATQRPKDRVPAGIIVNLKVPATSANLGPGFDAAGLALSLYDEVEIESTEAGFVVEITGHGSDYLPTDARHLLISKIRQIMDSLGWVVPGLIIRATNRIPHSRGLGSSAAAHVAAVLGAAALLPVDRQLTSEEILQISADFEGHPDNVAPALVGALTLSWTQPAPSGDNAVQYRTCRIETASQITPVIAVPSKPLATAAARNLLPDTVTHKVAAANAARAALLAPALSQDPALLFDATEDQLHQNFRRPAMPESLALIDALREEGHAAVVSGAGPTVMVLAQDNSEAEIVLNRVNELTAKSSQHWDNQILPISAEGATVEVFRP